jgi:leucyl/phenylalanyl-tRNA--protein transferase
MRDLPKPSLTPQLLLEAYRQGLFPMADSAHSKDVFWVSPERRGVMPLQNFHIPKRLKRTVRQDIYTVRIDDDIRKTMLQCAAPRPERESTWINDVILDHYTALHEMGYCHAVDVYNEAGDHVGGLYGLALGAAFFGESMFSTATDASKVALVHLVGRLKAGGFTLLDTQFLSEHLRQFGAVEIPKAVYLSALKKALDHHGNFDIWPYQGVSGAFVLQSVSQTS